jgi:hypothetical protein
MKQATNRGATPSIFIININTFCGIGDKDFDSLGLQKFNGVAGHLEPAETAGGENHHLAAPIDQLAHIARLNALAVAGIVF